MIQIQHCQRYNWPEGWVQLTKVSQPRFNFMTLQISFPAAKCWPNSSSKILPELQLQNLDQTLCSKSEPKFSSITKPQLPNMQQTVANKVLIINTRPKPAYGRQGLAGSWGQDTDKVSNFWVFLTSHFAQLEIKPTWDHSWRYKSTWHHENQTWSHNKNMKNQPGTMKNHPGTMKNH